MLSDELKGINWDTVPIRNFLDARPTPKSVAGALIKLGFMSPYEVDDYDWEEIDYSSYTTVRELLEDYARRKPNSKLEDLLSRAGKALLKRYHEEEPPIPPGENPLEVHATQPADPKEAIARLVEDATSIDFLETIDSTLAKYIKDGLKPPEQILQRAINRAVLYAMEVADRIIPPDDEALWKYFAMKIKAGIATNPVLKRWYSPKVLSRMALNALSEAELIARKPKEKREPTRTSTIQTALQLLEDVRNDPFARQMVTLLTLELSGNTKQAIDTNSIKPSKLLGNPTAFAYAVLTNKQLAEEAIRENPKKAEEYLRKLKRLMLYLDEVFALATAKKSLPSKSRPVLSMDEFVRRRVARTIATHFKSELHPPSQAPVISLETKKAIANPEESLLEARKKAFKEFMALLRFFMPNLARAVEEELTFAPVIHEPPKNLLVPTLHDPIAEAVAEEILKKMKTNSLPKETKIALETYGLPVGNGYLKYHNGRILHEITAVLVEKPKNIRSLFEGEEQPEMEWVQLRPLALLYWFDPLSGLILKQTGEKSLRVVGVDDIYRSLAKKTGATAGQLSGVEALRAVMSEGKFSQLESQFRGPQPGTSARSIGTWFRSTGETSRPMSREELNILKELAKEHPDIIENILNKNPRAEENLEEIADAITRYGYEDTIGALEWLLRTYPTTISRADLGMLVKRAVSCKKLQGRYCIY